jgi:Actin
VLIRYSGRYSGVPFGCTLFVRRERILFPLLFLRVQVPCRTVCKDYQYHLLLVLHYFYLLKIYFVTPILLYRFVRWYRSMCAAYYYTGSGSGGGASDYYGYSMNTVVLDIGSYSTKMGWAGYDTPRSVFRSVRSHNKNNSIIYFALD